MIVAIYSRKSKLTNKGESIENQIELCKDYAIQKYKNCSFLIYEDEGFSGKDTARPRFKQMLKDAKSKKFNILICYRLDRISRNVSDFSNTIEELNSLNISFVSIREQFDTSTPMGRAMMYIASVFAQLERETTAERVRDNMLELSKTGRWLGGPPPFGFDIYRSSYENGKEVTNLIYNQHIETVKLIYEKYLQYESLFKVNKYLLQNNIKGLAWSTAKLGDILRGSYYVESDLNVKKFLEFQCITTVGEFNGNGLISYNKTYGTKKLRNKNEWIYAVGTHKGVISSRDWIKTQELLAKNGKKRSLGTSDIGLLSGLIRCGNCGSTMTILYGVKRKDGKRPYYYRCSLKNDSGSTKCNMENAKLEKLDETVVSKIKHYSVSKEALEKNLKSLDNKIDKKINELKKEILTNESMIDNLIDNLAIVKDSSAKYISKKIDTIAEVNFLLEQQILSLESEKDNLDNKISNQESFMLNLKTINEAFEELNFKEKQKVLKGVIKEILWNGENEEIGITLCTD